MKPTVTRLSAAPLTGLACCPGCYRLISYTTVDGEIRCHACNTIVRTVSGLAGRDSLGPQG